MMTREDEDEIRPPDDDSGLDLQGAVPELIRRLAGLGLSGFFTTEGALRRALGDTLPQDWADFAADQSDRTRNELLDRIAAEFGRILQGVDLGELMRQFLDGRSIEVNAKIHFSDETNEAADSNTDGPGGAHVDFRVRSD